MLKCCKNNNSECFRVLVRRIKTAALALGMLAGIFVSSVASAATYYVSVTSNDAYSAVQAQSTTTPWATIQHAASNSDYDKNKNKDMKNAKHNF